MENLKQRVDELGPWVHGFWFGGELLGGKLKPAPEHFSPIPDSKAHGFLTSFPEARQILELGVLEGVDTFQLAQLPGSRIVGIEGRPENLAKARFLESLYGFDNITFVQGDIEVMDLSGFGRFDACMCSGVLYHVLRPWSLLYRIREVAPAAYIWTHYWASTEQTHDVEGYECKRVIEEYPDPLLRGLVSEVNWFTFDSLLLALDRVGFSSVEVIHRNQIARVGTISLAVRE